MPAQRNESHKIIVREERHTESVRYSFDTPLGRPLWFELAGEPAPPTPLTLDFALHASIFMAMKTGLDLHVEGDVTEDCIDNLYTYQEIWTTWRPDLYRMVRLSADRTVSAPRPIERTGVFAFSGGVDGAAALARHLDDGMDERRIKPVGALLINGFDVPIEETEWYAKTDRHIENMLSYLDLPIYRVSTNYRSLIGARYDAEIWGREFGPCLTASLHLFSEIAGFGVTGDDEDHNHIVFPAPRGPMLDHLGATNRFRIRTEVSDLSRCGRLALIAEKQPRLARNIRVCWERVDTNMNCGRCEKCVRTQLNFIAIGEDPVGFTEKLTLFNMFKARAFTKLRLVFVKDNLKTANKNKIALKWRVLLFAMLVKNSLFCVLWRAKLIRA